MLYRRQKRVPQHPHPRPDDVYVTRSSKSEALLRRIFERLHSGAKVQLHAMGAAVQHAVSVALSAQAQCGCVLSVQTDTVQLTDDLVPLTLGLADEPEVDCSPPLAQALAQPLQDPGGAAPLAAELVHHRRMSAVHITLSL